MAQKVNFETGLVIGRQPAIEGASLYDTQAHEPVKLAAKKSVRQRVKTQEDIDAANALSEDEESAQVAAEEAAKAPAEPADPPPAA